MLLKPNDRRTLTFAGQIADPAVPRQLRPLTTNLHKTLAFGGRKAHIAPMATPKFTNGQLVNFTPSFSQDSKSANGPYEILRQMPIEGSDETTYKIKSQASGQERIAREHQLEDAL
jgi:hypothetical protein